MKEEIFEKVIEYRYPNGDKYNGNKFGWFFSMFIFYFIYLITSPFYFSRSDFYGIRKVYYRRIK